MGDKLLIQGLQAACRLGVTEEERARAQPVWIDLELTIAAAAAAASDEVKDAVDYASLVIAVKQLVERRPVHLLETLAEQIAALILQGFRPASVTVRVKKRALPGLDYAAIEITRPPPAG